MKPRFLLVNPPVYDFTAYDFWLKPYGLLSVAGLLRNQAEFTLFDYMDRLHPSLAQQKSCASDPWGRGSFPWQAQEKPACLKSIPRYYRRFGLARELFVQDLKSGPIFDVCLIQTGMTYWYPGLVEVIEDLRRYQAQAQIILGGNYATICRDHALGLGSDLVVSGIDLDPLWDFLALKPDLTQPAYWELYPRLRVGAIKLTDGCPFRCTYCAVQTVYGPFRKRPLDRAVAEFNLLQQQGVQHCAFYDDALLCQPEDILVPFLNAIRNQGNTIGLHTPNALNARFMTKHLAELMVRAGFKTFYLGFESTSSEWQRLTGAKVSSGELAQAVKHLKLAGADPNCITAYQIVGHPHQDVQELEASMHYVHELGIRGMLADFSPIPGTPDGDICSEWVDLSEPLMHNKTAFPILRFGQDSIDHLKQLQHSLNRTLT
jgi:pyruvate-formate lyase-activating enzyme